MAKKKPSGKRVLLSVLVTILAIILVLGVGGTVLVNSMLNRINRPAETEQVLSDEEIESILSETEAEDIESGYEEVNPEDVELASEPAELISEDGENIINILLIGQDRRPGEVRQRSDAMILCTINKEKKTMVLTSFLRDLYVRLPDYNGKSYGNNRINACYTIGGMEMLDECLKLNFGVEIDYNVEVDFSGFESIVDILGGVDINLTENEAWVIGDGTRAGMNRLNGKQALAYSRIRYIDNDFYRTGRQRKVIEAIFAQVKTMNLSMLKGLVNEIFPLITTDMSNANIIGYMLELFPLMTELEVSTQRIPADDAYYGAMIGGMSVLVPDLEENRQILKDTIG